MQLTNILRDVAEDIERDRIYLPIEDLSRFGISEKDLKSGKKIKSSRMETIRKRIYQKSG